MFLYFPQFKNYFKDSRELVKISNKILNKMYDADQTDLNSQASKI